MANNRAEIIVELICHDTHDKEDLFDLLIPSMHGQLYSLYCILENSDALEDCTFDVPVVEDDILTITMELSQDASKRCLAYLEDNEYNAHYLKNDRFDLKVSEDKPKIGITFIRIDP